MRKEYRQYLTEGETAGSGHRLGLNHENLLGRLGMKSGHQSGISLDFKDYREYNPGDDLRHIDWHIYGRTDRLTVKLYREEVYGHLEILLDGSNSMVLNTAKTRACLGLSGLFASAASNAKCTHQAWLVKNDVDKIANGMVRPSLWDGIELDYGGNPGQALLHPPPFRRQGIRVLISDLLWQCEPVSVLMSLSRNAAATVVVQILAQEDSDPLTSGNVKLRDVETNEILEVLLNDDTRTQYLKALSSLQQDWYRACQTVGASFAILIAEEVIKNWQIQDLQTSQVLEVV